MAQARRVQRASRRSRDSLTVLFSEDVKTSTQNHHQVEILGRKDCQAGPRRRMAINTMQCPTINGRLCKMPYNIKSMDSTCIRVPGWPCSFPVSLAEPVGPRRSPMRCATSSAESQNRACLDSEQHYLHDQIVDIASSCSERSKPSASMKTLPRAL